MISTIKMFTFELLNLLRAAVVSSSEISTAKLFMQVFFSFFPFYVSILS